jgi:hypothetical protein
MSRLRILTFIALIALAFAVSLVSDTLAGEKFKTRTVYYTTKSEAIEVGDEEGHRLSVAENMGIVSNMEGKAFGDGWAVRAVSLYDWNTKTATGSGRSYMEATDRDGDKCYYQTEMKREKGKPYSEGKCTILKGTGKYEGIKGGANWKGYGVAPKQSYLDQEWDVEWSR